eukprot:scaffold100492_cov16-Prasinocladus_malaysianus.AAC.1
MSLACCYQVVAAGGKLPEANTEARASSAPMGVVFAWDEGMLQGADAEELSFEEARAAQYGTKVKQVASSAQTARAESNTASNGGGFLIFEDALEKTNAENIASRPSAKSKRQSQHRASGSLSVFNDAGGVFDDEASQPQAPVELESSQAAPKIRDKTGVTDPSRPLMAPVG